MGEGPKSGENSFYNPIEKIPRFEDKKPNKMSKNGAGT